MTTQSEYETRTVTQSESINADGPYALIGKLTAAFRDSDVDVVRFYTPETPVDGLTFEIEIERCDVPSGVHVDGDMLVFEPEVLSFMTLGDETNMNVQTRKYVDFQWVDEMTVDRRIEVPAAESRIGETAAKDNSHGWPGVAGYTLDGDTWCPQCAEAHEDIDTSGDSRQAILADTEWDAPAPVCAHCLATLDVRTIGGDN